MALSQQATPVEAQVIYYVNLPIAGSVWNDDPDNPLLLNADVIMPEGYDMNALQQDLTAV